MSPILTGSVTGHEQQIKRLNSLPGAIREELEQTVHNMAEAVKTRAQQKLSGSVLHAPTGAMKGSVNVKDDFRENSIISTIGINLGTIPYARIHEYGGTILPKHGEFLIFKTADGAWHKVRKVVMPERSYMRTSLAELASSIGKEIQKALKRASVSVGFK